MLIAIIILLIVSFTTYTTLRTTAFGHSIISSVLVDLTNKIRKENNLAPLTVNRQLTEAASLKAKDMEQRNYFAHDAPDGTQPWYWISKAGYSFLYAGENLALNFKSSHAVEKAWMLSIEHRDNILNKNFEEVGVATMIGTSRMNQPFLFVVQMFGKQSLPQNSNAVNSPHSVWSTILFNIPYYVEFIYISLTALTAIALIIMILIEIKKQHKKHILYGVLLLLVLIMCAALNKILLY
jgi:hypothetical protein